MSLLPYLHRVLNGESLAVNDAREAMTAILSGVATTAQIAGFLVALRMKGETPDELLGLAQAMREHAVRVESGIRGEPLLDTCGTGGDGQSTVNVSTIAALVAAGGGIAVAKHGNRSQSSQCGSADLLEALGARIELDPECVGQCIRETRFGFLFAPRFHPAMKHAAAARRELRTRTAFNLLGPLANPAGATVQVVGAPSLPAAELLAFTLARLGIDRAFVVHGANGLDEVSTTGETAAFEVRNGRMERSSISPRALGLSVSTIDELRGGDAGTNAAIARAVLGGARGPHRDLVVANAAVAFLAAAKAANLREGAEAACESLDSGAAAAVLARFVEFTQDAGKTVEQGAGL